jgi:ABC-type phosphate/phosphonate transport system substrate-binding protein
VTRADQEKVRQALLDMGQRTQGKEMLKNVPVQQFIPVNFDDYAIMRSWGLEKYWQSIQGE